MNDNTVPDCCIFRDINFSDDGCVRCDESFVDDCRASVVDGHNVSVSG